MYKGYEEATGRIVLLKVLTREAARDPVLVDWFEHEAKHVASIDHPNVVTLYHAGRDEDGRPYLVTEYVEGASLEEALSQHGPLPPELAAYVGAEVAAGLAAAHRAGILHRDLKPANILLGSDGSVKLADFGLATRLVAETAGQEADVRGTPGYLAPETVLGEEVGPSADLFALGATLVEALTGHKAFPAADVQEAFDSVLHHNPVPALKSDPRVPKALADVIETVLNTDAKARTTAERAMERLRESAVLPGTGGEQVRAETFAVFLDDPSGYVALRPSVVSDSVGKPVDEAQAVALITDHRWIGWLRNRSRWAIAALVLFGFAVLTEFVVAELRSESQTDEVAAVTDQADSLVVEFQDEPVNVGLDQPLDDQRVSPGTSPLFSEDLPPIASQPLQAEHSGDQDGSNDEDPVEQVRPPSEEQAPVPLPGRLTVVVQPWAEVFVDGRKMGEGARVDVEELPPGSHQIVLRNPEFPDVRNTIEIRSGVEENLAVSLWEHVARVTLQVHPWARVKVDGRSIGDVPPERTVILQPGTHTIELTHPQLGTWSSTVRVSAGERRTLPYNLSRLLDRPGE